MQRMSDRMGWVGRSKRGKSLVADDARADRPIANPALGLEEGNLQPCLSQKKGGMNACRACSDDDDVLQTISLLLKLQVLWLQGTGFRL